MLPEIAIELEYKNVRYVDVLRGLTAFGKDLEKDLEVIPQIARKTLNLYMQGVVESVRRRTDTPYPGGTSRGGTFPGTLSRRSGKLTSLFDKRKIQERMSSDEAQVSFVLSGIATVHETGATIRPKRAQYLTVPLPAALSGQGLPLKPNARAWRNTFVKRSKKGSLLIFQKQPGGVLVPLYVLVKSVTIPKRLGFEAAFEVGLDFLADKIAEQVLREFNNA